MGCWDVNPRKSPPTKEELEEFIKRAQAIGLVIDTTPRRIPEEDSLILIDYMELMK